MNGRITKRIDFEAKDGFVWTFQRIRWDDGREEVELVTPNDPDCDFYGEDLPRFPLDVLAEVMRG